MNHSSSHISSVTRALETLAAAAAPHGGLMPSLLDLDGAQLSVLPPAIDGQREGDRAPGGSNLMHDHAMLKLMFDLAPVVNRPDLVRAAERSLARFAAHCTNTPSGLFPWGEHSFWNLTTDAVGDSYARLKANSQPIHDHLLQAPLWLWEKLWAHNSGCVERFAAGLDNHWRASEPLEYNRHASILQTRRGAKEKRSCDFPRHSGFYILDLAFAFARTKRADFLEYIETLSDYWWQKRDGSHVLPIESRSPPEETRFYRLSHACQTLSLAVSLLEAAPLLKPNAPELATALDERAHCYLDGFLGAPHDLEMGRFVLTFRRDEIVDCPAVWGSRYGSHNLAAYGLLCLKAFGATQNARLLDWALAAGRQYQTIAPPDDVMMPAKDGGLALSLLAELFIVTGQAQWKEAAGALSRALMPLYCGDFALPRGAAHCDWYESQFLPAHPVARPGARGFAGRGCARHRRRLERAIKLTSEVTATFWRAARRRGWVIGGD